MLCVWQVNAKNKFGFHFYSFASFGWENMLWVKVKTQAPSKKLFDFNNQDKRKKVNRTMLGNENGLLPNQSIIINTLELFMTGVEFKKHVWGQI